MPYCTIADFLQTFGEQETVAVSNLYTPSAIAIDEGNLEQALVDVSAMIDGYIQGRVTLPLIAQQTEAKTITVVAKAKIMHSGTLYAEDAEITDRPEILQSLIDSGNAELKKK